MPPKYRLLKGVAHNLADSMFSATGIFSDVHKLPIQNLKVDLLSGKTEPEITHENKSIDYYRKWFLWELEKFAIPKEEIKSVTIQAVWKGSNVHVTCDITLKNGKKYTA